MTERREQGPPLPIVLAVRLALFLSQTPLIAVVILLAYIFIRHNESDLSFNSGNVVLIGCGIVAGVVTVFHFTGAFLDKYWLSGVRLTKLVFKNDMRAALTGVLDWGLLFAICMMTFGIDLLGHGDLELKTRLTWGFFMAVIGGAVFGIVLGRRLNPDRPEM